MSSIQNIEKMIEKIVDDNLLKYELLQKMILLLMKVMKLFLIHLYLQKKREIINVGKIFINYPDLIFAVAK